MQTRTLKSDSLLLLAAFFWGTTFVAQRMGMDHLGPMTYNALRFALGALTLLPLILTFRVNRVGWGLPHQEDPGGASPTLRLLCGGGLLAGLALFGGASLQQMGLVYTTAGKAGFITSLYVVLVPLAGLLLGHRSNWAVWAGAALAVAGLYLLSVTESFTIARGDLLVLGSAFFWTIHVLLIGYLAQRAHPLHIAGIQFLACAALSLLAAVLFENITLTAIRAAAVAILYAGIFSAGVAFTLQVVCQRTSPPAHAAIVMSLETVFAALAGYLILHERLTPRDLAGCALMFAGLIVVQLPLLLHSSTTRNPSPQPGNARSEQL
ncbi:MAG: DMT family transporter [Planctomycetes bacterium]|nr:DMT family transporter [Planctomycetota bacterium]